jgi:hypothetical protein
VLFEDAISTSASLNLVHRIWMIYEHFQIACSDMIQGSCTGKWPGYQTSSTAVGSTVANSTTAPNLLVSKGYPNENVMQSVLNHIAFR